MRYRLIAIIAVIAMIVGVMGIFTRHSDNDEQEKKAEAARLEEQFHTIYFDYEHSASEGMLLSESDFNQREITYTLKSKPQWLEHVLSKEAFDTLIKNGAVLSHNVIKGEHLRKDDVISLKTFLKNDFTLMPISVSQASLKNPEIHGSHIINLILVTNDKEKYNGGIYNDDGQNSSGSNYINTRVKFFSKNVLLYSEGNDETAVKDEKSSGTLESARGNESKVITYAYFRNNDVDKVLQAQIMGMFFAVPANNVNLNNGISIIQQGTREIMPSDIVSGAPVTEQFGQVTQIRGGRQ